jgi:putative transposase
MFPRRPKRLSAFDYLGANVYFLTFCTDQRRRAFEGADQVEVVSKQILRASTDEAFALAAYCYMPDHLHLLVVGEREDSDCRAFIKRSKQLSGFHYQQAFGHRLWQRYGYERVLRNNEGVLSVARYILENPVRARLVKSVIEYPFTGSELYSIDQILGALPWSPGYRSA